MSGCNCAHCPRSCSDEEDENIKEDSGEQNLEDSCGDDSEKEEPSSAKAMAGEKIEKLKQAIIALGFSIEATEKGLRISR